MDEKELVKRTKNSLKAKKSRAEILKGFQKKGYKLEYAEKLIAKANKKKKIVTLSLLSMIVLSSLALAGYSTFFNKNKFDIPNPMEGFTITGNVVASPEGVAEQIEITPEFISYLLNEFGAWQLHPNPLTFEKPSINFKIGEEHFSSEIRKEIITTRTLNMEADLQFNTNKETFVTIISSDNPGKILKDSISNGKISIDVIAGEAELLSKGYLNIYNSLK